MINLDIAGIEPKQYRQLMQYILQNCDEISFHLPGVSSDGRVLEDPYWKTYHEKNEPFLQQCFARSAKKTCSRHYQGMKLGLYSKIISVKPFPLLENMLYDHFLYDWLAQNGLPEDVCFFSEKQLWIFSCSHDEDFIIFKEKKGDRLFLNKLFGINV